MLFATNPQKQFLGYASSIPFWLPYSQKFQFDTFIRGAQMGQIWKFWPLESISLWNFKPVVCKVSLQDFLPILAALQPKIPIWYFRLGRDQMVLLMGVRLETMFGSFDRGATVSLSRYFWPMVRLLGDLMEICGNSRKKRKFSGNLGQTVTKVWAILK